MTIKLDRPILPTPSAAASGAMGISASHRQKSPARTAPDSDEVAQL